MLKQRGHRHGLGRSRHKDQGRHGTPDRSAKIAENQVNDSTRVDLDQAGRLIAERPGAWGSISKDD